MARNGEQLLLLIGIPGLLLVFFSQTDVLPTSGLPNIDFLMPGILSLAIMSTAMVSLGIATGFERSYGVLKRLGTTPLGTKRLVAAKVIAICCIELVQLVVLVFTGLLLNWSIEKINLFVLMSVLVLGTSCFAGLGLTLAGRLRAEVNLAAQNGLYLVLLLLGGILIPIDELPTSLANFAEWLPSSLLSQLLRDILSNNTVQFSPLIALSVWAITTCSIAVVSFKWSD